ncbi:DUF4244 domain-containing protein [Geodermatophilus sp. URMC 62]|uniref:DUF4244 domain-containing protein n=1 Tax=Geodermatophilus sp. URMC 62 TaxID=3423414 RepID=UPI00406D009A
MTVENPHTPEPPASGRAAHEVAHGAAPQDEPPAPPPGPAGRWARVTAQPEAGMSTAEYAVGTVAACAFAAVLYRVVTGGSIVSALGDLVESALGVLS